MTDRPNRDRLVSFVVPIAPPGWDEQVKHTTADEVIRHQYHYELRADDSVWHVEEEMVTKVTESEPPFDPVEPKRCGG